MATKGSKGGDVLVRNTAQEDFPRIRELARAVYPEERPYTDEYLQSQVDAFPEGQWVAVEVDTQAVLGMAASLIVNWNDYHFEASWGEVTGGGFLTTHDPSGRTLYGADLMVHPNTRGRGIGRMIYAARRDLAIRKKLLRIRAGARLRGYHAYADRLTPEEYAIKVVQGELHDPTVSFQLRRGFHVIAVVRDYNPGDAESLGHAALIEWINHRVAKRRHYAGRDPRFQRFIPKPPESTGDDSEVSGRVLRAEPEPKSAEPKSAEPRRSESRHAPVVDPAVPQVRESPRQGA
ncbi:MAG: GNAT family N-acetyltransferase [Planctomycetota bacterium]